MPAKTGLRVACVPPALVQNWKDEFIKHINTDDKDLNMQLIIAHKGTSSNGDQYDVTNVHNRGLMAAARHKFPPHQHVTYTEDTAQPNQDRLLILTTSESSVKTKGNKPWPSLFVHKIKIRIYDKSAVGRMGDYEAPGLVYGIAMIDECHEHYHRGKGRSGFLESLPLENQPWLWGYSGTPFSQTPRAIEGVLHAIESHHPKEPKYDKNRTGWEQLGDKGLGRFTWKKLDLICKRFETVLKKAEGDSEALTEIFKQFRPFLTTFMIRRTADTTVSATNLTTISDFVLLLVVLRFEYAVANSS